MATVRLLHRDAGQLKTVSQTEDDFIVGKGTFGGAATGLGQSGAKIIAQADQDDAADALIFEVKNYAGTTLFSVDKEGDTYTAGTETIVGSTNISTDLSVDGNTILGDDASTDTLTVNAAASFTGTTTLGNATTDDVTVTGHIAGDLTFKLDADHSILVAQSTDETAGHALSLVASIGGDSAGVAAGGVGGVTSLTGGAGGDSHTATHAAGVGGAVNIAGGDAGADLGGGGANGGALNLNGGNASGSGTDGVVAIGASNTSAVTVTPVSTFTGLATFNGGLAVDTANIAFTGGAGSYFIAPTDTQSPNFTANGSIRVTAGGLLQWADGAQWNTAGTAAGNDLQAAYDQGPDVVLDATDDSTWTVDETNDYNMVWTGGTNGDFIKTAASSQRLVLGNGAGTPVHVLLEDNTQMIFGTGSDVTMAWDGTDFDILAAADDSVLNIGNGTNSFDVNIFGSTASYGITWDASANQAMLTSLLGAADAAAFFVGTKGPVLGDEEVSIGVYSEIDNDATDNAGSLAMAYLAAPADTASAVPGNLVGFLSVGGFDADIKFLEGGTANVIADGGLNIDAQGTGGLTLQTTVTGDDITVNSGSGAVDVDAATSMTLDTAAGALSLNATGGAINIGNDADAQAINIGTGAAARSITVGNATGATSFTLNAGTGAVALASNATDHDTTLGSTTGGSFLTLQTGTEAMTFTAGGAFDVNATGAITMDGTTVDITGSSTFSIDGTGASNVSATSGNLTLSTITTGDLLLTSAAKATVTVADNTAAAFLLQEGANAYMTVDTTDAAEKITFHQDVYLDTANDIDLHMRNVNDTADVYLRSTAAATTCGAAGIGVYDDASWTSVSGDDVWECLDSIDTALENVDATTTFTAGENVALGDVVFFNPADSKVWKADAAVTAEGLNIVGIAAATILADATGEFYTRFGTKITGASAGMTAGDIMYCDETGGTVGGITATAPSTSGDVVFKMGIALNATDILYMPQYLYTA